VGLKLRVRTRQGAPAFTILEGLDLVALGACFQIIHLGGAEDLDAAVREIFEETGEGEGGAVDAALADHAVEPGFTGDELKLQLVAVGLEKVRDGDAVDGFLHGGGAAGMMWNSGNQESGSAMVSCVPDFPN